jgi:hypothetical protein
MVRKSKSHTSERPIVAKDADNYMYMNKWDGQSFDSLDWRREMHNCLDDVPHGAIESSIEWD